MPNEPATPSSTPTTPEPAGDPNLPPVGEYREAFSAIDDLPSSDDFGKRGESKPAPETGGKQDRPKESDVPSQPDKTPKDEKRDQPQKRKLGEDLDGLLKPKDAPTKGDQASKAVDDPDKAFEAPETPKALRETYRSTKENLVKAESRLKELEESVQKARKEGEETTRTEYEKRLAAIEKRRTELETELRYANYAKSEEFKEKYHGPLRDAWKETLQAIEGMTVTDSNGEEREVTSEDIGRLMAMPNVQARKLANELFGTGAPEIMTYRAKLMALTTARDKALDEWKERGSQREEQMAKEREAIVKTGQDEVSGYQNDYPELFGRKTCDEEGNALIDAGMRLARKAFLAEGIPDGLTPAMRRSEVLGAMTQTTVRAMAFPRVLRDLNAAKSEIETLRAKLKEYEGTEPGTGGTNPRKDSGESKDLSPEDMIDAIPGAGW